MASQIERRAKTRIKIIQAAKTLFEKMGFDGATVDQIVTLANVSKGTFYQYYETKIDVLADVTRHERSDNSRQALEMVANGNPAIPVLEQYILTLCQWLEAHEKIAEALIFASFKTDLADASKEPQQYTRVFLLELMTLAQQQGTLRKDIPAVELSKIIAGSLVASVLGWVKNPQPGALLASMQFTLKIFLEGAKS